MYVCMYVCMKYIQKDSNSVNLENERNPVHRTILFKCQNE